jgi:hypothetical protein
MIHHLSNITKLKKAKRKKEKKTFGFRGYLTWDVVNLKKSLKDFLLSYFEYRQIGRNKIMVDHDLSKITTLKKIKIKNSWAGGGGGGRCTNVWGSVVFFLFLVPQCGPLGTRLARRLFFFRGNSFSQTPPPPPRRHPHSQPAPLSLSLSLSLFCSPPHPSLPFLCFLCLLAISLHYFCCCYFVCCCFCVATSSCSFPFFLLLFLLM